MSVSATSGNGRILRPPAVPLIAVDPNFSVWSFADQLYAEQTRHWTGAEQPLVGLLRIDGGTRAFMGRVMAANVLHQTALDIGATTTRYTFECPEIRLCLDFFTPLLLDDLDVAARPVSYVAFEIESLDGKAHDIGFELGVSALLAVNQPDQIVRCEVCVRDNGPATLRAGTLDQPVLGKMGDNLRIDWGHVYLYAPAQACTIQTGMVAQWTLPNLGAGPLPKGEPFEGPAAKAPLLCARLTGHAGTGKPMKGHLLVAYDDGGAALEVFGRVVPGYWARNGLVFSAMLAMAAEEYATLRERCASFDTRLNQEAQAVGGRPYRDLCALAYRQSVAAHKLVADAEGCAEFYSKECFSNGCMGTVDVSYPSIPLFLLYNPELVKAMMRPVCAYARSPEWQWDFAPHDVGRYPKAFGQAYGRVERDGKPEILLEHQMPVEECGNLLVMFAAVAKAENDASFAAAQWDLVEKWAHYLIEFGADPGDQLCTDDFAGHLAHNANLAIKAVIGVGAYGLLCRLRGRAEASAQAMETAYSMAAQWVQLAADAAGHYRLAYDAEGSWSLKYNLLWDALLGLHLFPPEVVHRELASYAPRFGRYGIPLDNRQSYTKSDWMLWCACLEPTREGFARWVAPVWRMLDETPHRVPFTDWYFTDTAGQAAFQNRSVQGALFARLLQEYWRVGT